MIIKHPDTPLAPSQGRRTKAETAGWLGRLAQAITNFTGSMNFVWLHVAIYGGWIAINLGLVPGLPRFDPTLLILACEASVEAICLSTIVVISQNRMASVSDHRADLDLHANLRAEHELTTLARLVEAIADPLGIVRDERKELTEATTDAPPEVVLDESDPLSR